MAGALSRPRYIRAAPHKVIASVKSVDLLFIINIIIDTTPMRYYIGPKRNIMYLIYQFYNEGNTEQEGNSESQDGVQRNQQGVPRCTGA